MLSKIKEIAENYSLQFAVSAETTVLTTPPPPPPHSPDTADDTTTITATADDNNNNNTNTTNTNTTVAAAAPATVAVAENVNVKVKVKVRDHPDYQQAHVKALEMGIPRDRIEARLATVGLTIGYMEIPAPKPPPRAPDFANPNPTYFYDAKGRSVSFMDI